MKPTNPVKDFVRSGGYAWPGKYPTMLVMSDGACLCAKCARQNYRLIRQSTKYNIRDGWGADGVTAHMEGPPEVCANCNADIPSAYGTPDDSES